MPHSKAPLDYESSANASGPRGCRRAFFGLLLGVLMGFGVHMAMGRVISHFWPNRFSAPYGFIPGFGIVCALVGSIVGMMKQYFWGAVLIGAAAELIVLGGLFAMMAGMIC
jgi:hypothetical protein